MSKTSTQVKNRYNAKTYTRLSVALRNEVFQEFEKLRGDKSKAEFVRELIELYRSTK